MGIGFKHGGAGGGVKLNFRVLGGTAQPSSPKTNDIWIKSATAVNGYRFCSNTPSGTDTRTGNVYIVSETSSDRTTNNTVPVLNILDKKENGQIIRCLLNLTGCYQVVNGEWESMNAYLYKGGAWLQFSSDFPEYWFHYVGHGWNAEMGAYSHWTSGTTVGTDEIAIPVKTENYGQEGLKVGIYQETAMDFTNFQKLKFEYKSDIYAESGANNGVFIGIGKTTADWPAENWDAQMIFRQVVSDWTPYEIDISSVNKSSRLRLMVWAIKGSKAYIRNITLE